MSDTPITDAAECANFPSTEPVVAAKEMRKLERENAKLRGALMEMANGAGTATALAALKI